MNPTFKSMSFNILYNALTEQRTESVRQTVLAAMPDTVGFQEATPQWMSYLKNVLSDVYDCVGLGRDGGGEGEHSPVFYRKDRFELIKTETKWMSDTPDTVSKYEESSLNRVFTYALLLEKETKTQMMVVNTHLDHTNPTARERQAAVLLDFLKEYKDCPIVLTGDFNTKPGSPTYRAVTELLADSAEIAESREPHPTFHAYRGIGIVIDYAFVSSVKIKVTKYGVITEERNGMLPSDHYPVVIEYSLVG